MSTLEIKKEFHTIIETSNDEMIAAFYEIARDFLSSSENSRKIIESEIDIKLGKLHSQNEVKNIIENWKE